LKKGKKSEQEGGADMDITFEINLIEIVEAFAILILIRKNEPPRS
jgi:hypothetical protein